MKRGLVGAALAVGFVLGAWSEAEAQILSFMYSGVINSGVDIAGEFGTRGDTLYGKTFEATQSFDTDKAQSIVPNSFFGAPATASLTINGKTLNIDVGFDNVTLAPANYLHTEVTCKSFCPEGPYPPRIEDYLYSFLEFNTYSNQLPSDLNGSLSLNLTGTGSFGFFTLQQNYQYEPDTDTTFDFIVDTISVVPIPASLHMFSAALLILGAFAYCKRLTGAP